MAAELYVYFSDKDWYKNNKTSIIEHIECLDTFVYRLDNEFWLRNIYDKSCDYDLRIFLTHNDFIFLEILEISSHPLSVENSLTLFLEWLRTQTPIVIQDEDGEISRW